MTPTYAERESAALPWWIVLLEGIFAAIFGLLLLTAPGATLLYLVQVFGFYLLIGGILRMVSIFADSSSWGWKLLGGIFGILAGVVVLNHPLWSAMAIPSYVVYVIGFLTICIGAGGLIQAFQGGDWGAGSLGILTIIFGHRGVKPPDWRGSAAVCHGRVHASREHWCHRGVVPPAFEPCYPSGDLSFRGDDAFGGEGRGLTAPALFMSPSFREDFF